MLKRFLKQETALGKFMFMCSVFSVFIVATLVCCELAVRRYVPNPYKYKHERLSQNSDDISTLILGSSHGYYGIRPQELGDSAFNLSNVSQIFRYDYLLLTHYPFKNLKTVILPLSYSSFTEKDFSKTHDWVFAVNYKIYMDINVHSDFSRYNLELARPSLFTQKLRSLIEHKPLSYDSTGFGLDFSREFKSSDWESKGPEAALRHTGKDLSAVNDNIDYLSKIAEYCRKRNIKLVLVLMPAWKTYRDSMKPSQYRMVTHLADSLSHEYGFRYLNMIDDKRFIDDDYYDGDHFTHEGAAKFTGILRDTVAN